MDEMTDSVKDASETGALGLELAAALADEDRFLRLTLLEPRIEARRWNRIVIRPVRIKGLRLIQWTQFDDRKDLTSNLDLDAARSRLAEAVAAGFRELHAQMAHQDLHARMTRKGRLIVARGKPSRPGVSPDLKHDRRKPRAIPQGGVSEVLVAAGILSREGKTRPGMGPKYRQINEFLDLLRPVIEDLEPPVHVADMGCGKAYLTFALMERLRERFPGQARITGVDANPEVIGKNRELAATLGWPEAEFVEKAIAGYVPGDAPDIVLSLHACDTATDDAIAFGIRHGASAIFAAPCCQHELNARLGTETFRPLLRHGILRERMADLLTDAFRAQLLTLHGYRTDVVEFVSPEATTRNLLIRARRTGLVASPSEREAYESLKAFWDVEPYLERLAPPPGA